MNSHAPNIISDVLNSVERTQWKSAFPSYLMLLKFKQENKKNINFLIHELELVIDGRKEGSQLAKCDILDGISIAGKS